MKKKRQSRLTVEEAGSLILTLLDALADSAACTQVLAKRLGIKDVGDCKATGAILGAFRRIVTHYIYLAQNGNPALIAELPIYAQQLVEATEDLSLTYPELLAKQAKHQITWPIMAARHYPKESDFKRLADAIKLGTKAVVNISPRARYKLNTPINRFLLRFFGGSIATAKEFHFVQLPDDLPKLTAKTLPRYLDEFIMPALNEIREKEGSWDGIPQIAAIVKGIPYEAEHRSAVRNRIKRALKAMAMPRG